MRYYYPPRPRITIPHTLLSKYEATGEYACQYKYNGKRTMVYITAAGEISLWDRHHKECTSLLSLAAKKEIRSLPGLGKMDYILDSEMLLKTKASDTKGKIVVFDVICAGEYLWGQPKQAERLKMIADLFGNPTVLDSWRGMMLRSDTSQHIFLAPVFTSGFVERFSHIKADEIEGVVLRKLNSSIEDFAQDAYEADWLIRCRLRDS